MPEDDDENPERIYRPTTTPKAKRGPRMRRYVTHRYVPIVAFRFKALDWKHKAVKHVYGRQLVRDLQLGPWERKRRKKLPPRRQPLSK